MQSQWELLFIENIKKICKPFQLRHQTTFERLKKIDEKTDNRAMNERINEWMNEGIDDESIQNTYSTGWKCHRYFVYNLIIFEAEKSQMKWINITNIINKGGKKTWISVICECVVCVWVYAPWIEMHRLNHKMIMRCKWFRLFSDYFRLNQRFCDWTSLWI